MGHLVLILSHLVSFSLLLFHIHIPISILPWFFIYIPVSYLSNNLSDKMSQYIYPHTNILLLPYYSLPFQTSIWHLIWYLASSILYVASGIWHPIWYLASSILYLVSDILSGI